MIILLLDVVSRMYFWNSCICKLF